MPQGTIEHVNLTVSDPDRSLRLFARLLGWKERWRGPSQLGGRTIHVGSDKVYLALYTNDGVKTGFAKGRPLNHVGLSVGDIAAAEEVVRDLGLEPFNHGRYEPGPQSFYFLDWDGIEFEVVSYE